jgi:maltose/moltooligosaccharide transporter
VHSSPADDLHPVPDANAAATVQSAPRLLSLGQLMRISALWWGLQFFWASQQLIVMPERVRHFVPIEDLGSYYGMIKSFGALVVLTTQLVVGFLSDHADSRLGRRRPFVLWGTIYGFGAIVFFMFAPSFWWLFAAYMLISPAMELRCQHARSLDLLASRLYVTPYIPGIASGQQL